MYAAVLLGLSLFFVIVFLYPIFVDQKSNVIYRKISKCIGIWVIMSICLSIEMNLLVKLIIMITTLIIVILFSMNKRFERRRNIITPQNIHEMVSWFSLEIVCCAKDLILTHLIPNRRNTSKYNTYMMSDDCSNDSYHALLSCHDQQEMSFFNYLADSDDLWFDFMADCGDGWNASYQVARLISQPNIVYSEYNNECNTLPRGQLLLIGGDLCYPNPSKYNYEHKLFRVFRV